jgi:hypothetical protein
MSNLLLVRLILFIPLLGKAFDNLSRAHADSAILVHAKGPAAISASLISGSPSKAADVLARRSHLSHSGARPSAKLKPRRQATYCTTWTSALVTVAAVFITSITEYGSTKPLILHAHCLFSTHVLKGVTLYYYFQFYDHTGNRHFDARMWPGAARHKRRGGDLQRQTTTSQFLAEQGLQRTMARKHHGIVAIV